MITKGEWQVAFQYDCGCLVKCIHAHSNYPYDSYRIEYCPKHKAAPEMYEALKILVPELKKRHYILSDKITNALAKAEGK
jgi:hypothetical protein